MKSNLWIFLTSLAVLSPLLMGCATTPVKEEEKALLITIDDIAATGVDGGNTSEAGEKYAARRFINNTTEVEDEFDSENDPQTQKLLFSVQKQTRIVMKT